MKLITSFIFILCSVISFAQSLKSDFNTAFKNGDSDKMLELLTSDYNSIKSSKNLNQNTIQHDIFIECAFSYSTFISLKTPSDYTTVDKVNKMWSSVSYSRAEIKLYKKDYQGAFTDAVFSYKISKDSCALVVISEALNKLGYKEIAFDFINSADNCENSLATKTRMILNY